MRTSHLILALVILLIVLGGLIVLDAKMETLFSPTEQTPVATSTSETSNEPVVVLAENLEIPWDIAFLPGGELLVTERPGRLVLFDTNGTRTTIETGLGEERGEGGLLGLTLHPDFETNNWLYIYMTAPGTDGRTENRVERYRFADTALTEKEIIIEGIPGAPYHDGGRIAFGPDSYLYIATGDSTEPELAQDVDSLAGKILRIGDDGSIPADNPFGSAVWSYGHRNPQGLAWDQADRLWSTEHGRTTRTLSGLDEINLIERGKNYGWPQSEGDTVRENTVAPVLHSGADTTWAPASAAFYNSSLFFGGLRGEALYEAVIERDQVVELKSHFEGEFGRIRTVRVGPDSMLYLTTSNRDGRGNVQEGDDKIIRINPDVLP